MVVCWVLFVVCCGCCCEVLVVCCWLFLAGYVLFGICALLFVVGWLSMRLI